MADNKESTGLWNVLSDWWSGKGDRPRAPSRIPPVSPQTGNRYSPSPELEWTSEGARNAYRELQRSHFGADYIRDLLKMAGKAVSAPGESYRKLAGIGNAVQQILDAREFEQTGKWPESTFSKYMPPSRLKAWRDQATQRYRAIAASYSYIDPRTKKRTIDWEGIQRGMSNDPVGTLAPIFGGVANASGRGAKFLEGASAAQKAAGKTGLARVSKAGANIYRGTQAASNVAARALNPAGAVVAVAAKPVAVGIKRMRAPRVLDEAGEYTPEMQAAMRKEGLDPDLYSTPEYKAHFQEVVGKTGITPAAIRKAVGTSVGIPVTRSMAMGERPPAEFAPDVAAARQQGQQFVSQQMLDEFGHAPDERNLGAAFARSYVNAKNGVERAYQQAFSHQGAFTNTADFTSGVRGSIENELASMGLDINTVMNAPRFAQSQNALGGFNRGGRRFGGVFGQFDELAGSAPQTPVTVRDLAGEPHSFDPASGVWTDSTGRVLTPGQGRLGGINADARKVDFLNSELQAQGGLNVNPSQNGLTPQNIDGVRRDVNSFYNEARSPEDKAVLAAINRGIDSYIETNAANFSGDGAALSRDLQNARSTNIQFIQNYDKSPNKVIRDASKLTADNMSLDSNGTMRFTGDPQNIGAHLESRIIDPKTLQPRTNYTGGNTVTGDTVFKDLYNVFDQDGQNALVSHVRNTVASSPADPNAITTFINNNPFFSPAEQEMAARLQNARGIASEAPLNPSTLSQGTGTRWGMRFSAPLIGQQVGQTVGGVFGPAGSTIGGTLGMMGGSALEGRFENLTRGRRLESELNSLPNAPVQAPHLFMPLTLAESATGATGQNPLTRQPEPLPAPPPPPAPVVPPAPQQAPNPFALPSSFELPPQQKRQQPAADPYALPSSFEKQEEDPYALPESFNEPRSTGGRAAYKSGGAVTDIEPLVRNLMNRASHAKKMTNKDTETLLNSHDDAIASALAVAQKSI